MTVHESGDKGKPVIMLFPGTMCYWKGNFGSVIDELKKTFLVAASRTLALMMRTRRATPALRTSLRK